MVDGQELSIGMIHPGLEDAKKAECYVDLLLAPSGEAQIYGEPSALLNEVGGDHFQTLGDDEREVIAATLGLTQLASKGSNSLHAVRSAISKRPKALSTAAAWLAYTPPIGTRSSDVAGATNGRAFAFKSPEASDSPRTLTDEQDGVPYLKAVAGAVSLILSAAGDAKSRKLVQSHLCQSPHFENCMFRLVALVGLYREVALKPDDLARNQVAMLARDTICALCERQSACAAFIDEAHHPFRKSVAARQLVEAIRVDSNLQLHQEGKRPALDVELTAWDWAMAVAIGVIFLVGIRYANQNVLWPGIQLVLSGPTRLVRNVFGHL
jgi:hypothetical protein